MLVDYIAYQIARQRVASRAYEAFPDSPVRPDDRDGMLRHRVSVVLRRLADRLEPARDGGAPVVAGSRC